MVTEVVELWKAVCTYDNLSRAIEFSLNTGGSGVTCDSGLCS